jgi:phenylpyruvate tautomerase
MAYLSFTISNELFEAASERLIREASGLIAQTLRKSESAICVSVSHATMVFGGDSAASAFVELRSPDGLDANANSVLSKKLCDLLMREADVPPDRVYLNFVDLERASWGHGGRSL